jgi:hypothetical protein
MRRFIVPPILITACLVFSLSGCGARPAAKTLVARVGDYELTAEDFRDELGLMEYGMRPDTGQDDGGRELLDEIITRKVLAREAMRRGLDRDRIFMAEIERYWEQALIKRLFNDKTAELAADTRVSEEEVRQRYGALSSRSVRKAVSYDDMEPEIRREIFNEKVQRRLDAWMASLKDKSGIVVYEKNLEDIDMRGR